MADNRLSVMDDTASAGVVDIVPVSDTHHHQRMSLLEEIEANLGCLSTESGRWNRMV